jgi:FkbM family methyltransferase
MKTRTGEPISVRLMDAKGGSKELTEDEMTLMFVHGPGTLLKMLAICLSRFDLAGLGMIAGQTWNKVVSKGDQEAEKRELLNRLIRFQPVSAEVRFNGQSIVLPDWGTLRPFIKSTFVSNTYDATTRNIAGRVVVDGGAHLGTFSLMAIMLGAKKVYAFEPVIPTFQLLKKHIELNNLQDRIIATNKALGDKNERTKIYFTSPSNGLSSLSAMQDGTSQDVEIVRLDDALAGGEVGFIKLDTEGWEEAVLNGARESIKAHGPVLSMAAYHKPTDVETLPRTVRSINPAYGIRVNHFSEEDLYCELPART